MTEIAKMGFQIWAATSLLTLWSTWYACFCGRRRARKNRALPSVSILKPLCGREPGLEKNLETFFRLKYPNYEILFTSHAPDDPALAIARRVMKQFPRVRARIFAAPVTVGANPKINDLVPAYRAAANDLLFLSDSNVRVGMDTLARLVAELTPGVGLVTSPIAATGPRGFAGRLEAVYVNTFFARWFHIARAWNLPLACGKALLLRRSDLERAGGLAAASHPLADDVAMLRALRARGFRHVITATPIRQHVGRQTFRGFWARQVRWGIIRKSVTPWGFPFEPLLWPITSGMGGAFALHDRIGISATAFAALHLLACAACDFILVYRHAGARPSPADVIAWLARELLAPPLWLHAAVTNVSTWRGRRVPLRPTVAAPERPRAAA